jgi:hypothetical protein
VSDAATSISGDPSRDRAATEGSADRPGGQLGRAGDATNGRVSRLVIAAWSHRSSAPIFAAALSALIFVIQTWPWLRHLQSYGIAAPGDGMGGSALWQAMVKEHLNPFAPGHIAVFNAPSGLPMTWQVNIQQWPTTLIMYFLTWLSGGNGEFAFTVYIALGVVLTSASMAWLAERLTKDRLVAIIIGVALPLAPFLAIASSGHPAFVHDWTIAATVGAIWALYEHPSPRRALGVGILGFVAMSWSGYQLLFVAFSMVVVMAGFMLASIQTPTRALHARDFSIVLVTMLGAVVVQYVAILLIGHGANPASSLRHFGPSALVTYGARWYEFFVPDSNSILFGGDTRSFFATHLHGSNPSEATLYIGLSLGVLVVVGLIAWWRDKLPRGGRVAFAVCGVLLFMAGAWASLPLYVGTGRLGLGIKFPTFAGLVGDFTGNWRVFSRFVVVALVGWLLMAAGGLAWIGRGRGLRRYVVLAIAAVAIAFDLYTPGMVKSFRLAAPQIAAAVHRLPAGEIAQYPLVRGEIDGYAPLYNQPAYGHPVLNGYDDQPQEALDAQLQDLSQAGTVQDLGLLHVRYVLDVEQPFAGVVSSTPSPLLRIIASGMYGPWPAKILEVPTPHSNVAVAVPVAGFSSPERVGPNAWQWLSAAEGTITLLSHCTGMCRGDLRFELAAFGPARDVTLRTRNGRLLAHLKVSSQQQPVSIPLNLSEVKSIAMGATPGPIPIARLQPGTTDPRSVSVQLINIRWVASPT